MKMVDRLLYRTNTKYLLDTIEFHAAPKKTKNSKIREKYLETNWSAQQLADHYGVSKQMILGRLRAAGVRGSKRRGRSPDNYRFPNPPYGYVVKGGRLATFSPEMKVARFIVELRDRKGWSFQEIAEELKRKKLKTRMGSEWARHTVRHVHKLWTGKI